jgi:hypothetical protein
LRTLLEAIARQSIAIGRSLATRRFVSVENKHSKMSCNTSRLIHAVLISQTRLSSPLLSSLCSASIVRPLNATYTS